MQRTDLELGPVLPPAVLVSSFVLALHGLFEEEPLLDGGEDSRGVRLVAVLEGRKEPRGRVGRRGVLFLLL